MEDMIPPITTVAKGRWTSAPVPVARAIGINPREATKAVIKTGLNRMSDPCRIASSSGTPSLRSFSIKETITIPFSAGTEKIEIFGSYVVPEFGHIVMIILLIGVVATIFISKKTNSITNLCYTKL